MSDEKAVYGKCSRCGGMLVSGHVCSKLNVIMRGGSMSDENKPVVGRVEPPLIDASDSLVKEYSAAMDENARLEAENKRLRGELNNAAAYIERQIECEPKDGCGRCDGHRAKAARYRRAAEAVKEGE